MTLLCYGSKKQTTLLSVACTQTMEDMLLNNFQDFYQDRSRNKDLEKLTAGKTYSCEGLSMKSSQKTRGLGCFRCHERSPDDSPNMHIHI